MASTSNNLQQEWQECCSKAMGYELVEDGDEEKKENEDILLVSFLDDDGDESVVHCVTADAWMENANRINDSLNIIIEILERKQESYLQPHKDDEASLLESTILSFVATTANQIEALRQAISSSNRDYLQHCVGIVGYLMTTLKEDIANPFAKLQKQRARPAMSVWDNPLQCRLVSRLNPLDTDDEDRELRFFPKNARPLQSFDFMDTYEPHDDFINKVFQRPISIMELKRSKAPAENQTHDNRMAIKSKEKQRLPYQPVQPPKHDEEEYNNMLQQEAILLTATLQNDLDSVQQVEARMTEITALLAQFSNLVSEQQVEITTIHETTVKSQQNVEKGHDHLVDAAERTKKSRHYMAGVVTFMAILLLFFNAITP
jgi:t-SNARE complex subunit (syntaxin)